MQIKILGAAAGGGLPQWNCACVICRGARAGRLKSSMHASMAVSSSGKNWYLINATPDIRQQVESSQSLQPKSGETGTDPIRNSPVKGIFLTDAELDHTIGLLILRENARLAVYATRPVLSALETSFPVTAILSTYGKHTWTQITHGETFFVDGGRLEVLPVSLGSKKPRYAGGDMESDEWVVGYRITDLETGGTIVYAPSVENFNTATKNKLNAADCLFIDGTFWLNDEMKETGATHRLASDMGHVCLAGKRGSLETISSLDAGQKYLVHINNTNPVFDTDSVEHTSLKKTGIKIGYEGLSLEV